MAAAGIEFMLFQRCYSHRLCKSASAGHPTVAYSMTEIPLRAVTIQHMLILWACCCSTQSFCCTTMCGNQSAVSATANVLQCFCMVYCHHAATSSKADINSVFLQAFSCNTSPVAASVSPLLMQKSLLCRALPQSCTCRVALASAAASKMLTRTTHL